MMIKVETSALGGYFVADPGRDAGLRVARRRAGTAAYRPAGAVADCTIRAGERGAL
jgi:hypothetical protein